MKNVCYKCAFIILMVGFLSLFHCNGQWKWTLFVCRVKMHLMNICIISHHMFEPVFCVLVMVDECEMSFHVMLEVKRCPKHSSVCTLQCTKSYNGNKNVDKIVTQALQETFAIYILYACAYCLSFPFYTFVF